MSRFRTWAAACLLAASASAGTMAVGMAHLPDGDPSEPLLSRCERVAMAIVAVADYRGTPLERECFGQEDDPRVGAILTAAESAARILR